jgi:fructosamine-3-kinase
MSLPRSLANALAEVFGDAPQQTQVIGGSDWSTAARFNAKGQPYLVKWLSSPFLSPPGWPDMLAAEAYGLAKLREAQALRVPEVHAQAGDGSVCPSFIVMEWIEPAKSADRRKAGQALGHGLAAQHRTSIHNFGLDQHNYCGATPQANDWTKSWIAFYGQRRLGVQMELAQQQGRLPRERQQRLERLIDRLDRWIDDRVVQPSLLHGDLWAGNWLVGTSGEPVLIDPAVYFGDREAELAMCHLFGGFPEEFFHAYDEAWPPAAGRDDRIPLYQLYHLLNHLNLFGESYSIQIDQILRRYVG